MRPVSGWGKSRQLHEWNRTESPGIDSRGYQDVISNEGAKATQWSKGSLFNKWRGTIGHHMPKDEFGPRPDILHTN